MEKEDNGTSIGHETLLERTSTFHPRRVSAIVNRSIIRSTLMRNVQNCLSKEAGQTTVAAGPKGSE
jgi:hypothetical protein